MKKIRFFIFTFIIFSLFMILGVTNVEAYGLADFSTWNQIYSNYNGAGVMGGNPPNYSEFTITKETFIQGINNYHYSNWNNSNNLSSQTIGLLKVNGDDTTKEIGEWNVTMEYFYIHWLVFPEIVLEPGTYRVIDSHPGTWSWNSYSESKGFTQVSGGPIITTKMGEGSVSVDNYNPSTGETVIITATPTENYRIKSINIYNKSDENVTELVNYVSETKTFTMPNYIVKVKVEFELIPPIYTITKGTETNGTFTIDKSSAESGATITVTPSPSLGYRVKSAKVNDGDITVTNNGTNYTFSMPEENVTVNVEFELITKTVAIREMENGTVTSDKSTVTPGETVTLTVTPSEGYKLKEIKILDMYDEIPVTLNEDNTFTMPSYNVFISAEFELIYTEKTITKTEDDMTLSAKGTFSGTPLLTITKTEKGNEGYNSLITLVKEDKEVICSYDVTITGGTYEGELELTFTVGKQYEGDKITIYHKKASGDVETLTATVKDGKVVITVSELSPFMLVADKEVVEQKDATPNTGIANYIGLTIAIIGFAVVEAIAIKKINFN